MRVAARLLPPPRLQYAGEVFTPGLSGEWNIMQGRPTRFVDLPPNPNANGTYTYGILIVGSKPRDWEHPTKDFKKALEKDAYGAGLELYLGGPPCFCSGAQPSLYLPPCLFLNLCGDAFVGLYCVSCLCHVVC